MRNKVVLLAIIFNCIFVFAQEGPKVVVFNESEQQEATIPAWNLLKIGLLEPFNGDIAFYYERVLGENISLEGGLGITIDDYFGSILFNDFEYDNDRIPLIGYSVAAGFRYYPFIAADEFYFAPELKYRYYHHQIEIGSGLDYQLLEQSRTVANFRVTAGYNLFFDDKVFIDFYGGLGLAMNTVKEYEAIYNETTFDYDYLLRVRRAPRPWLTLGMKFGFGF